MIPRPPKSTPTATLFPAPTLFRSAAIDALDCVERSIRIFGDDHRYRLADVSHTPGGKGRTGRAAHRRPAFRLRSHGTGQGAEPPAGDVLTCKNRQDTR